MKIMRNLILCTLLLGSQALFAMKPGDPIKDFWNYSYSASVGAKGKVGDTVAIPSSNVLQNMRYYGRILVVRGDGTYDIDTGDKTPRNFDGHKIFMLPKQEEITGTEEGKGSEKSEEEGVKPKFQQTEELSQEASALGVEQPSTEEVTASDKKDESKAEAKEASKIPDLGENAEKVLTKIAQHNNCTREKAYAIFLQSLPDFTPNQPVKNKQRLSKHNLGLGTKQEAVNLAEYRTLRTEHKKLTPEQRRKIHKDLRSLGISYSEHEALEEALAR